MFTHFHSADLDDASRDEQEARFDEALAALPERPALVHAENGPAVERARRRGGRSCRPGIFLYGVAMRPRARSSPEPVAAIRARIVEIRTIARGRDGELRRDLARAGARRIATVPVGYADGYRRALGNRGVALLAADAFPSRDG